MQLSLIYEGLKTDHGFHIGFSSFIVEIWLDPTEKNLSPIDPRTSYKF